jgi:hypothetical protein
MSPFAQLIVLQLVKKFGAIIEWNSKSKSKAKGKAIPLQALTGPEDSRRLRLPDFKTIGTRRW